MYWTGEPYTGTPLLIPFKQYAVTVSPFCNYINIKQLVGVPQTTFDGRLVRVDNFSDRGRAILRRCTAVSLLIRMNEIIATIRYCYFAIVFRIAYLAAQHHRHQRYLANDVGTIGYEIVPVGI